MNKILKKAGFMSLMFVLSIIGLTGSTVEATSYTAADVALHATTSDCYMILSGNVYNLTSFVNQHSGGASPVAAKCGMDGSTVFNTAGPHSSSTINALNSLLLGPLGTAPALNPTPTPTQTPSTTPILSSVTLVPSTSSAAIGGTIQLTTTPKDQNGSPIIATTTYTSSNTGIATVTNTGLITGVAAGNATITATSIGGTVTVIGTSNVTITTLEPVLTSIILTPNYPVIKIGKTLQLIITPKDQSEIIFTGATTTFASNDPAVATVNNSTGLITGISLGSATITATTVSGNTIITTTKTINVVNKNPLLTLTNVTIAPINPTVSAGSTLQLVVTAKDQNGSILKKTKTTFASSNHVVAKIHNKKGIIKGVSAGTSVITVTSFYKGQIIINNIILLVTNAPLSNIVLGSTTITPNISTLAVGEKIQITANPKDTAGLAYVGSNTKFISSNSAIAKVNEKGKITGISGGVVTITAITKGGAITVMGTATVTVKAAPIVIPTPVVPITNIHDEGEEEDRENEEDKKDEELKSSIKRTKVFKSEKK